VVLGVLVEGMFGVRFVDDMIVEISVEEIFEVQF
jgi:hypothetical protein